MKKLITSLSLFVFVAACGGVDMDQKASEVSLEDAKEFCKDNEQYEFSQSDACWMATAIAVGLGGECQSTYDACMESEETTTETESCDDLTEDDLAMYDNCDATLAEIDACLADQKKAFDDMFGGLTCDNIEEKLSSSEETETPASCVTVNEKCPSFAGE